MNEKKDIEDDEAGRIIHKEFRKLREAQGC